MFEDISSTEVHEHTLGRTTRPTTGPAGNLWESPPKGRPAGTPREEPKGGFPRGKEGFTRENGGDYRRLPGEGTIQGNRPGTTGEPKRELPKGKELARENPGTFRKGDFPEKTERIRMVPQEGFPRRQPSSRLDKKTGIPSMPSEVPPFPSFPDSLSVFRGSLSTFRGAPASRSSGVLSLFWSSGVLSLTFGSFSFPGFRGIPEFLPPGLPGFSPFLPGIPLLPSRDSLPDCCPTSQGAPGIPSRCCPRFPF